MIKRQKVAVTVAHGGGVVTATQVLGNQLSNQVNGLLRQMLVLSPAAVDASATISVQLVDTDGVTVYDNAATQAANTKTVFTPTNPIAISSLDHIQVTYSAAQTATNSVTNVVLLLEK